MRKLTFVAIIAAALLTGCGNSEQKLKERAAVLCRYVPDHQLLEESREYMTADFHSVLDTMFHMPEFEAMDHEWLYYFVTGNGGTIADFDVRSVELTDAKHAVASILVRQKWEDGSFDPGTDVEEHKLYMEKVGNQWLMSDFDGHKADCIRHIRINRHEQAVRAAISQYLVQSIAPEYLKGEFCAPTIMIVASENDDNSHGRVYGDFRIWWYKHSADTLQIVSGGSHPGCMYLEVKDGKPVVTRFEQTVDGAGNEASARRIFGQYFDTFQSMHSNSEISEIVRKEQLEQFMKNPNN